MSLKDFSIEFFVSVDDAVTRKCETSAPIYRSISICRVIVSCRCCCFDRSTHRGTVGGVESLHTLAPRAAHSLGSEGHGSGGCCDPTGVPTGSRVIPHDLVWVVHLLPFLVLVSGPADGIIPLALAVVPFVVVDLLVSLLLCEVGVVWYFTLDTPHASIDLLRLPVLLNVFEVLDILGVEDVIGELGIPIHVLVLVDEAVERQISGEHLRLHLVRSVGHGLHGVVVAVSDCEHSARPADDLGLVTPGLFLNVLFEVPGSPLESLEDIHFPVTA